MCSNYNRLQPFNGVFSGTTWVSQYQKGKTNRDFTGARDSEWQWHQLGHMQVCTSLKTGNHASTPPLSFFTGRMPFLPPNQQCQSTEGTKCSKCCKIYQLLFFLTDLGGKDTFKINIGTLMRTFYFMSRKMTHFFPANGVFMSLVPVLFNGLPRGLLRSVAFCVGLASDKGFFG